ncbi:uncharacterized protein LOC120629902 [Pararge aegeria]|uniref:Jg11501 protein n=2 Tax=Pararge aegeria TaxID=116150 RepID=A0A8S4RMN3_9NEOP|nr:uncharacterized protein LOC120629902 [Pararge aegeria]CAH2238220.1 jg11501 [Pararge aegeria aegeria]
MEKKFDKKFPNGALTFYIKLYCKRKGDAKKKCTAVKEAMKSWISLNKSEKQLFVTKYNEHKSNFKKNIAMCLKQAEPYLRSKVNIHYKECSQNANIIIQDVDKDILNNKLSPSKIEEDDDMDPTPNGTLNAENTKLIINDFNNGIHNNTSPMINTTSQDEMTLIPEPTAPKIMTSKELFTIIKEKENNELIWEELTLVQRRRYQEAVRSIKKNYIKQYRKYLEHLSSDKLFNHYRNIVNSA